MPKVMTIGRLPGAMASRSFRPAVSPTDRGVVGPSDYGRRRSMFRGFGNAHLPAAEPAWRTDWNHPPPTTPQEPQNLLRPTNKGCGCSGLGALPAGRYQGRLAGYASNTGGSMSGRSIRGAVQGIALGRAGLGGASVTDWACGGGAALSTGLTAYGSSNKDATAYGVAGGALAAFTGAMCAASGTDEVDTSTNDRMEEMEREYQQGLLTLRQQNQESMNAMAQARLGQQGGQAPAGLSQNAMIAIGAVGVGVLALILLK